MRSLLKSLRDSNDRLGPISRMSSEPWRLFRLPEGHPDRLLMAQLVMYVGFAVLTAVLALTR